MRIIINADDFALNKHCTDAICEAFSRGLITDTTMIANADADSYEYAVKKIESEGLSGRVGIHFNLTEGTPLTEGIKSMPAFVDNGKFRCKLRKFRFKPLSREEKKSVYEELSAQINKLEKSGIKLSHVDSHHHIHVAAVFVTPIVVRICQEHNITKIRIYRNYGSIPYYKKITKSLINRYLHKKHLITTEYFGNMYDVRENGLKDNLEVMVHPDFDKNGVLIDRHGMEDGFPIGDKLPDLRAELNVTLKGYAAL